MKSRVIVQIYICTAICNLKGGACGPRERCHSDPYELSLEALSLD